MKEIKIYSTLQVSVAADTDEYNEVPMHYADEIQELLANEDTDLADYANSYHGGSYYKKLHSVKLSTEVYSGDLYAVATCTVNDDWNDTDTAELKEYLTGQYADGLGEHLEQQEIASFRETETYEEYDEEADEYYESECEVSYSVYVSLWQDKNFRILTEAELKKLNPRATGGTPPPTEAHKGEEHENLTD